MFIHPYIASQLAREHRRDMLAEVSRRQLRRQRGHQATRNANAASRIIRRVATAMAGAGIAALTNSHRAPPGHRRQRSQPAGITQQRHCPDERRTRRGAAYVVRGRERDAR
jgi:hypothetical protein